MIRILIWDTLIPHANNIITAISTGYGSDISSQCLIVPSDPFVSASLNNDIIAIVRSYSGWQSNVSQSLGVYPNTLTLFPVGSNNFELVSITQESQIPPIVLTGAGDVGYEDKNNTGYGIEFWDSDLTLSSTSDESSYSTGIILGKLLKIKDTLNCSWWEARYRARKTAVRNESNRVTSEWDLYNGYGIINVIDAINYNDEIISDPFLPLPSPLIYYNTQQSYTAYCSANYSGSYTYVVENNIFSSSISQADANLLAYNFASSSAIENLVCTLITTGSSEPIPLGGFEMSNNRSTLVNAIPLTKSQINSLMNSGSIILGQKYIITDSISGSIMVEGYNSSSLSRYAMNDSGSNISYILSGNVETINSLVNIYSSNSLVLGGRDINKTYLTGSIYLNNNLFYISSSNKISSSFISELDTNNFNSDMKDKLDKAFNSVNNTSIGHYTNNSGSDNIAIGYGSLYNNVNSVNNIAIGNSSLNHTIGGGYNVTIGVYAMYENINSNYNTAIGTTALRNNRYGDHNTAIGNSSLYSNLGSENTAIGKFSLLNNIGGTLNTAIGVNAGSYLIDNSPKTNGDYGVYLGANTKGKENNTYNEIVIGYDAEGNGSNTVTLGNYNITKTFLKGNVGIKTNPVSQSLEVNGDVYFTGSLGLGARPSSDISDGAAYLHVHGNKIIIDFSRTIPSSDYTGRPGEISWDNDYLYICLAPGNNWGRVPLELGPW